MITDFVSITKVQRNPNEVFDEKKPFQIVLCNNQMKGLLVSSEIAKYLLQSNVFDDLIDDIEVQLLHDKETLKLIKRHRSGKTKPIPLDEFRKKHGV